MISKARRVKLLFLFVPVFIASCSTQRSPDMEFSLREILADYPEATVGVSAIDLESGRSFRSGADRIFHAASTMKVPVMIEAFRQASLNRFSMDDSIEVKNTFSSIVDGSSYVLDTADDSDREVYARVGGRAPVRWLVERMITVSSNLATNILIDFLAADSVQATIERLGTTSMRVYRGVEDIKAYELGLNNTATATDLAVLLQLIAEGKAVSAEADASMVDILLRQEFNSMIPAGVPAGVRVAHKTGSITKIHHDAGIVYSPGREPLIMVVLTEGIQDHERSAELAASISKALYRELVTTTVD